MKGEKKRNPILRNAQGAPGSSLAALTAVEALCQTAL